MTKESPGNSSYSRNFRTILIEPFKQIKLGLYVISLALTFVGLTSVLFVNAFHEQYQQVMGIFRVVDPKVKWELLTNDIFVTNLVRIGILFLTFILALFVVIFRTTHKYYGPLVSIDRFVHSIRDGDYTRRIVIRRGDELQNLVNNLNEMAASLERRYGPGAEDLPDRRGKPDRRTSS